MKWFDEGYLIKINSFNENSSIGQVFTHKYGKFNGLIYGTSSSKKKSILQISNKLKISYSTKSEDSLGYFNFELIENISSKIYDQKIKLNTVLSALEMIDKFIPERQAFPIIYNNFNSFLKNTEHDVLKVYLLWENTLLTNLGYGLNFEEKSKLLDSNIINFLGGNNEDYIFDDLLKVFEINSFLIKDRLNGVIEISKLLNRNRLINYLNER